MLVVEGLSCEMPDFKLKDISFSICKGEYFVLLGESGAGKTIVLELLCGLLPLTKGRIFLEGRDITNLPVQKRRFGLVFQDNALFPHMTVWQNIAYALPLKKRNQVSEFAARVGAEHLLERYPATLSGGEAQRVALARAIAADPVIIMLDEPTASLDSSSKIEIRSVLRSINALGITVIHVTHDYEEAISLASTVGILENGNLIQAGSPLDVFHHPRSKFVANFIGIKNFFRGALDGENFRILNKPITLFVSSEHKKGRGCVLFESESVVLSSDKPSGSTRNVFYGKVVGMERAKNGMEVCVDAGGVQIYSLITFISAERMKISVGDNLWVSFKSTAVRFIPESYD